RSFTDADTKDTPRVTLIDEEFARRYWPGEDPIGKRLRIGGNNPNNPTTEIIGVVRRVKMDGLKQDSDRVQSYYAFRQQPSIRMALGAQPRNVLGMVVRQGMVLTIAGLALGLGGALLATRLMASLLFGVSATDPLTFVAIPLLLAGVALGACFVPARRATKVDPMIALRYE